MYGHLYRHRRIYGQQGTTQDNWLQEQAAVRKVQLEKREKIFIVEGEVQVHVAQRGCIIFFLGDTQT